VTTEPWVNQFGWRLPLTDRMLSSESPYAPLDVAEQSIAERLMMLAHLTFDTRVWGSRLDRYWDAFAERVEDAATQPDLASWWTALMRELSKKGLTSTGLLHEKNLLCHPRALPGTPIRDTLVLGVFRSHTIDLRDRTRMWVYTRRQLRVVVADADSADDVAVPGEPDQAGVEAADLHQIGA
jgi:hypothetical protein